MQPSSREPNRTRSDGIDLRLRHPKNSIYNRNTVLSTSPMKTITLKADDNFDALLSRLAKKLNTSRSAVIRDAVQHYEQQLQKDALRGQLRAASRKTREQARRTGEELDAASGDEL